MARINFDWISLRPDQREYRQQSLDLVPKMCEISVEVPDELFVEKYVLSLEGLRYVIDQFDTVFLLVKKQEIPHDNDWEEDEPKEETKSAKETWDKEDWDESADFDDKTETDKVPWNDDGKDWE